MKNKSEVSERSAIDLSILFNLSEDLQGVLNDDGYFEKVNDQFILESGRSESQLLSLPFSDIIHQEDKERIGDILLSLTSGTQAKFDVRFIQERSSKAFHCKVCRADDSIYLSARSADQPDTLANKLAPTGNANLSSGHNEYRFQTLVQNSSDIVAIISVDGDYEYVSPSVKRILGFDPEYYIGKNAFSFLHPDDHDRVNSLFGKVLQNYKVEIQPFRFLSSDSKWHWVETVATNLLHDPAIKGIVLNSRDVTLQMEMKDDILRNSRRFNNLIENNKDGSFTLSRDWRFTSLNSVVKNTVGLPPQIAVGANIWKAIPNGLNTTFYFEFKRAFEENTSVHFREFSPLFNRWFEVNAYPFEESLTVMIRDITELKIQQLTLSLEKEVLEMNAASIYSLGQLADHLLSGFEKIHYGLKTSLGIIDKVSNTLHRISVPAMPEFYGIGDSGSQVKLGSSPCTRAALIRSEVHVQNIFTEKIAADYRDILKSYNISSSRSIPVIDKNQEVLAVFTIFNNGHQEALMKETSLIQRLGTIIQLLLESNQAKKDEEQSRERFQLLMQATSDSIWDFNLKSNQVYRGKGFDNYFDQQAGWEDVVLKKWEHNIHPDDANRVEESLEKALSEPSVNKWTAEYRYMKKDGSYASVIDKGIIVRNSEYLPIRIVGAVQDISELKDQQRQLVQSEENYKNMFSKNPTPMWTYDMESKCFTMVNDAALCLYGYTREEFLQLNLFSIRIESDHEKLKTHLESPAFLEDLNISHEWTHLKKDQTPIIVDVVSHPLLINGRRSRLVAIKDITDKKKDRQEILAQNQRLRDIAQISSHETRKPLASILGLVDLFDKENLNNPLNKEIVHYLSVSASELDTVIHNIVKKTWLESEVPTPLGTGDQF